MNEHSYETHSFELVDRNGARAEMTFCKIPACPEGFLMGNRGCKPDQQPVHRVVIPGEFWLAQTPVTQQQFRVWTESEDYPGPPHKNYHQGDCLPADNITWLKAVAYCQWLTKLLNNGDGDRPSSVPFPQGMNLFRLPYEAEWEYACRAGTETEYYSGDGVAALSEVGWHQINSRYETQKVGRLPENSYGLHDMHGNVYEWCQDLRNKKAYRRRWDGITAEQTYLLNEKHGETDDDRIGEYRIVRGGSAFHSAEWASVYDRSEYWAEQATQYNSFRVCLACAVQLMTT